MVNKTLSRALSCPNVTSIASVMEVMMNEHEQTAGSGERHSFLRKNAHLGPIPWTGSLRRARRRRGNPQHFVRQHEGMVKRLWQKSPADPKARRPNAKIAKNTPENRTNSMLKCLSAHLHTTSYLARFLAKTCHRLKRAALREYATGRTATPADFGVRCSTLMLHPCIFEDGLVLAPNRKNMHRALRNNAPKHTNTHQIHKQANKSYADAGSNPIVLVFNTPPSNLPAMANDQTTTASTPRLQGMPAGPYESPSTRTPEKQIQGTKERSTVIAFLGKWKRGLLIAVLIATKTVISTTVITNKDRTHKYTTFKKWKLYTRLGITTTNLNAHTVRTSLTETLGKWRRLFSAKNERHITKKLACALTARLETQEKNTLFKEWWLHTTDISVFHHLHVQLFLKGLASEIHTITGPYLVTRRQLHETIAEITSIPPQEQHLASIHNHADTHNADLLYMEKGTTLQLLLHLNGDSGSSRPSSIGPHKHAKPLTHQTLKFHICVNGPDQHQNALRVLLNDKIDQLNESLEERVDPPPSYQTLFRHRQQLDDDLRPDSGNSDEMNYDDDKSPTNGKAGAAAHPPL